MSMGGLLGGAPCAAVEKHRPVPGKALGPSICPFWRHRVHSWAPYSGLSHDNKLPVVPPVSLCCLGFEERAGASLWPRAMPWMPLSLQRSPWHAWDGITALRGAGSHTHWMFLTALENADRCPHFVVEGSGHGGGLKGAV